MSKQARSDRGGGSKVWRFRVVTGGQTHTHFREIPKTFFAFAGGGGEYLACHFVDPRRNI